MKTKLLLLGLFFTYTFSFAQVTAGQVDDFEDGTVQGWMEGAISPNPPTNIATGGPAGAGDNFLQNISVIPVSGTVGRRMAMFNTAQWGV